MGTITTLTALLFTYEIEIVVNFPNRFYAEVLLHLTAFSTVLWGDGPKYDVNKP